MTKREAWEIDLDRYLAKEEAKERLEQEVQERVKYVTSEEGEFYPFTLPNLQEAMQELDKGSMMSLAAISQVADSRSSADELLGTAFRRYIREYWERLAETVARQELE